MQLNASATLPAPINVAKSDQSPLRRHLVSLAKLLGKFAMSPDAMLDGLGRAGVSDDDARATANLRDCHEIAGEVRPRNAI